MLFVMGVATLGQSGVLGSAVAGDADCPVTGDEQPPVLGSFRGVVILRPADFWGFEAKGE